MVVQNPFPLGPIGFLGPSYQVWLPPEQLAKARCVVAPRQGAALLPYWPPTRHLLTPPALCSPHTPRGIQSLGVQALQSTHASTHTHCEPSSTQNGLGVVRLGLWSLGMVKPKLGCMGKVVEEVEGNNFAAQCDWVVMCLKQLEGHMPVYEG